MTTYADSGITEFEDVEGKTVPIVGVGAGAHVPEEAVYEITKTFWEGVQEMETSATWLRQIQLDGALQALNLPLHPGALR